MSCRLTIPGDSIWLWPSMVNSLLVMGGGFLLIAEINKSSWRNHLSEMLGRRRLRYNIASPEEYSSALRTAGF